MTQPALEAEVDRYIEAIAQIRLESRDLPTSLWNFKREVLQLARYAWPPEAEAWYEEATTVASPEEIENLLQRINHYRAEVPVEKSDSAALASLFHLLFYYPVSGELTPSAYAALCYFVNEFSIEFISHFGQAEEVLDALRRNLQAPEA
jgi:hypothetical protein